MKEEFKKFNYKDGMGNELIVNDDGVLTLFLVDKFSNKKSTRNIGEFTVIGEGILVYRKYVHEKNIFKKTNSWGINWYVLSNLSDDGVIVQYGKERNYYIRVKEAMRYGSHLWFKTKGLEKQYFIPVDKWRKSKEEIYDEAEKEKDNRKENSVTNFMI